MQQHEYLNANQTPEGVLVLMDPVVRVKNMVRHSLIASPNVTNRELLERAREIAPEAVEGLSLRQFHGKYRLPIMRHEMGEGSRARIRNGSAASGKALKATRPDRAASRQDSSMNGKRGKIRGATAEREGLSAGVRAVLVKFAVALEKAESRSDLVQAMAGVDAYVAEIVKLVVPVTTRSGNGNVEREPTE